MKKVSIQRLTLTIHLPSINKMAKDHNVGEVLAVLSSDVQYIKDDIRSIKSALDKTYVTKSEFEPIKRVVYGLVTIILTTVVGAWVSMTSIFNHK